MVSWVATSTVALKFIRAVWECGLPQDPAVILSFVTGLTVQEAVAQVRPLLAPCGMLLAGMALFQRSKAEQTLVYENTTLVALPLAAI